MVSTLLRPDIRMILALYTLLINANIGAGVSVLVIFYRSAAIVFDGFESFRENPVHSEAHHHRHCFGIIGNHLLFDKDLTLGLDGILKDKFSENSRQ